MTIDKQWLTELKVGDPVMIHWYHDKVPQYSRGTVERLLVREIEILESPYGCGFGRTFKFRKSDGRRWPLNAYRWELWRIRPLAVDHER
jgi:hypothetical protein